MTLIMVLAGWCLLSVPVGLVVGPLLARRTRTEVSSAPDPVVTGPMPVAPVASAPLPL